MEQVFLKLLNMSISASWLVLAVVVLRLVMKKAPKWVVCLMWAMVAVRLVCPFSFESMLSLIPSRETVPQNIAYEPVPAIHSGVQIIDRVVNPVVYESFAPNPAESANPLQAWTFIAAGVWVVGMVLMAAYALVSWGLIRRKVSASVPARENVWICDYIDSPFILGILKPRIYLPSAMMEDSGVVHVLAHERAHLKRKDHWWKPLGFVLLAVYWFNPVMWVAYVLLCRDIEMACDERVIKDLGEGEKKQYSEALLSCSVSRRMIAACPLAFGEVGVKARVKSVLNYKKPAFWIMVLAIVACVVAAVCFLTDPVEPEPTEPTEVVETTGVNELGQLTLEDVRRLAQKGNDLSWEDFADYPYTDIGSGLYIHEYKIDEVFSLRIGGVPSVEPMYIRLTAGEEYVDIRTDDVDAFIEKHQTAANSAVAGIAHGNASVYLQIPEGWEYETVSNEDMSEFGIAFWPEGYIKGQVKLMFMEQGFGVCGTGLETKEIDGLPGGVGYYWDGNPEWTFITFPNAPGAYVAMTEAADEWWPEYEDQVMEILGSAELGVGIVRKEEAIAAAQEVAGENGGYWSAWYDVQFAVWRVEHYESPEDSSPRQTVLVDSKGYAVSPDEWGILLTATNVTPVGLTLNCIQSGGMVAGDLMTGQHYWLERWNGTEWEILEANEDAAWTMEALLLPKNDTTSWNLNWEWLYGRLSAGSYRIGKHISHEVQQVIFANGEGISGKDETRTFYADFEIGASLLVYDENAEYMLLGEDSQAVMFLFSGHEKEVLDSPMESAASFEFQNGEDYLSSSMDSLGTFSGRIGGELVLVKLSESEQEAVRRMLSGYLPAELCGYPLAGDGTSEIYTEETNWQGSWSVENLAIGETSFFPETITFSGGASWMSYNLSCASAVFYLEFGLVAEDGTEIAVEIQGGGKDSGTIENIPAGTYRVFVRNSEVNKDKDWKDRVMEVGAILFDSNGQLDR